MRGPRTQTEPRRELELVLMIRSQDPQAVVRKLSALQELAGYLLTPGPIKTMRDVYFDTSHGMLARKKMNLRVREVNGTRWITWKRSPGLLNWRKRNERQELELAWSEDSLSRVIEELSRASVKLKTPRSFEPASPAETMMSTSLHVLQDRETTRRTLTITSATGEQGLLAELAIDSVSYHFEGQDVELHEVEVEAGTKGDQRILNDIANGLLGSFGTQLQRWRWGKLVTGKMIRKMLEKGMLRGLLDGPRLRPEAVDLVRKALAAREL